MPYFAIQSPSSGNATQLQGRAVSATAPTGGQVLGWDGSSWVPAAGVTGPTGAAGLDAPRLLNGTTGPVSGYGRNGDYFIDTSAGVFYGPKTSGSWGAGLQLQTGQAGPTGPAGVGSTGPVSTTPGPTGATGPVGNIGPASTVTGPSGPQGPQGATGPTGYGATGPVGPPAGITIGTVTSGSTPSATITGAAGSQVLSLVLARGSTGPAGSAGATGPIAGLAIGNVQDGGSAGASIYPDGIGGYLLDLTLPRGPTGAASTVTGPSGATGPQGLSITGAQGPQGQAGPTGSTGPAGQSITGPTGERGATGPAGSGGGGSFSWASVPSGPTGAGTAGDIAYNAAYFFVCIATNTWRRAALSTWSADAYWSYVKLLLRLDGSLADLSADVRTVTEAGFANSTTQSKWGTASRYNNSSSAYLQAASMPAIGTGDYVLEAWVYPIGGGAQYQPIFDTRSSSNGGGGGSFGINTSAGQLYADTTANFFTSPSGTVSTNAWTHLAWARSGGTLRTYINGTLHGSASSSLNHTNTSIAIGGNAYTLGVEPFRGYLSDVRVTIGSARGYTGSTITTPTASFPVE